MDLLSTIFVGQKLRVWCRMSSSCSAIGCTNCYKKGSEIKFYRFPKNPERRRLWVRAMRRDFWKPNVHSRLCSTHFISHKLLI